MIIIIEKGNPFYCIIAAALLPFSSLFSRQRSVQESVQWWWIKI